LLYRLFSSAVVKEPVELLLVLSSQLFRDRYRFTATITCNRCSISNTVEMIREVSVKVATALINAEQSLLRKFPNVSAGTDFHQGVAGRFHNVTAQLHLEHSGL